MEAKPIIPGFYWVWDKEFKRWIPCEIVDTESIGRQACGLDTLYIRTSDPSWDKFQLGPNLPLPPEPLIELKPCPFCRGEVKLQDHDPNHLSIWCKSCSASFHITSFLTSKEKTIVAWNRRD